MTESPRPGRPAWKEVRAALEAEGFRPSRRLGQNFLLDENMVRRIAADAELDPGDFVLEPGTGCGFLTAHLAGLGARVLSVEVDRRLFRVAERLLAGHGDVELLRADVLAGKNALDPAVLARLPSEGPWHVAGNLPYAIASPLLVVLSRLPCPPATITALVQAEVATRVAAEPGGRDRGPLSVRLQDRYRVRVLRTVPPRLFWPRPKVDSAVVRLVRDEGQPPAGETASFDALVELLFRSRRKAVGGLLARALGSREVALRLLEERGLSPDLRAEALPTATLRELARSAEWARAAGPGF